MKIAYLGLLDGDRATGAPRGERHLLSMARGVVAASRGTLSVELLSCGPSAQCRPLCPGVVHRVLPWVAPPPTPWDAASWELATALDDAALVHLHDGFSRSCELGLLLARLRRTPVCLTEFGLTGHWISVELGWQELADTVICHSRAVADGLRIAAPVRVVSGDVEPDWFGVAGAWPSAAPLRPAVPQNERPPAVDYARLGSELSIIYRRLLSGSLEAAA